MYGDWYHAPVKTISRGKGHASTLAMIAYRTAQRLFDERTGEVHDYTRKQGVLNSFLVLPKDAPAWGRERLWNEVEKRETRKNAVTARELELALPFELPQLTREVIARAVCAFLVERYGVGVDCSLHAPSIRGDQRNFHAHILFTTRRLTRDGLGEKTRELDSREKLPDGTRQGAHEIETIRAEAARLINRELERAGIGYRVDHRSFKRRGMDQEPTHHLGHKASAMERKGKATRIGDHNRTVQARNAERQTLQTQARAIEASLKGTEQAQARARPSPANDRPSKEQGRAEPANKPQEQAQDLPLAVPVGRPKRPPPPHLMRQERIKQRERFRFELARSKRLNAEQERQWAQRQNLSQQHEREQVRLEARLEGAYTKGKQEARERLSEIERNQQKGGFWYQMRKAKGEAEEAKTLNRTLENIHQREGEERARTKIRQDKETRSLEAEHAKDWQELNRSIEAMRKAREAQNWEPTKEQGRQERSYSKVYEHERSKEASPRAPPRDTSQGRERGR